MHCLVRLECKRKSKKKEGKNWGWRLWPHQPRPRFPWPPIHFPLFKRCKISTFWANHFWRFLTHNKIFSFFLFIKFFMMQRLTSFPLLNSLYLGTLLISLLKGKGKSWRLWLRVKIRFLRKFVLTGLIMIKLAAGHLLTSMSLNDTYVAQHT